MYDLSKGVVVFAYNFVHRKTQDFIFRLHAEGIPIRSIIAADPVKLSIPPSSIRTKVRHAGSMHPKKVAEAIGVEYVVMAHKGQEIEAYLELLQPEVGIISGARILGFPVISKFSRGIINFHPGLIPEARGLDALLWGINNGIRLGVTSHLIDSRVDAGLLLEKRKIDLYKDDTLFDLSERLYEVQLEMIKEAVEFSNKEQYLEVDYTQSQFNRKMPQELEENIESKLPAYLEKFAPQL